MHQHPLLRLIGPLFVALIVLPLGFAPPQPVAAVAVSQPEAAPALQATMTESESNDSPATADLITSPGGTWATAITAAITSTSDLDYFKFDLAQPASRVQISLDGLPADYDLVLATGPDVTFEQGSSGVDDITGIGSTISSIGSTISSIGSTISSIGSTISSIGGGVAAIGSTISSIGSTISSISANTGNTSESIDTFLWQPGTYYVAVGAANGEYSARPYRLTVRVAGSGLGKPADPAPEVEMRITSGANPDVTTLYIVNYARMRDLYPDQSASVSTISNQLLNLVAVPPSYNGITEEGYIFDIGSLQPFNGAELTVENLYAEWDANLGNPFYANKIARFIDNVIKAATDPARKGSSCLPGEAGCTPTMQYDGGEAGNGEAPFPNVKYIVLVGGDNILPFFRTPDLTTIANEADYAAYLKSLDSSGVIDPLSPQGAALKYRMTLSDNPYGTDKPLRFQGFPLFVPSRAVGRLVESPDDIARYLNRWSFLGNYTIDLQSLGEVTPRAYVNGYDFLTDQATKVSQTLSLALDGGLSPTLTGPINDDWRRADLESSWFEGDLTAASPSNPTLGIFSDTKPNDTQFSLGHPNKLFSLNSHFDHWQILPAVGANPPSGTFLAKRVYDPSYDPYQEMMYGSGYFGGTLGYSVGCHSGYNVLDGAITFTLRDTRYDLYRADFAQAFVRQAGSWIGNTGYGYGTADGIDYSERLALFLTQELLRDVRVETQTDTFEYVGSSIGMSLMRAKQRYIRNVVGMSAYDAKALTVMSLYGLPFIRVQVDSPLDPPPEEQQFSGSAPVDAPSQTNAPIAADAQGRLERTITVTISLPAPTLVPRTGSRRIIPTEQSFKVEDSFVKAGFVARPVRPIENNQVGLPNLPAFAYDISALSAESMAGAQVRLKVRDVVFVGGTYNVATGFNPQITQIVTETDSPITSTSAEPSFAAGAGIWYPDKFFGFSSVGQGDDQRDQMVATAAQFKADPDGVTGQMRSYKEMVFKVYYIDPESASPQVASDETAPTIKSVRIDQMKISSAQASALAATTSSVRVVALIDKGDGTALAGVSGVYVKNGTVWTPVTFTKSGMDGSLERWEATIDLPPGAVRAIISATDAAGNVSYYTAKGTFNVGGSQVYLPLTLR